MNEVKAADVSPDTPLRLEVAAKAAFPDGSISINSLRGENRRRAAGGNEDRGKCFVTLRAVKEMGERCRVTPPLVLSTESEPTLDGQDNLKKQRDPQTGRARCTVCGAEDGTQGDRTDGVA